MATATATPATKIPLELHHNQLEFVRASERFTAVVTGIGWGKTYALAIRAAMAACGIIGNNTLPVPNTGVITAPTYANLRDVVLRMFLDLFPSIIADFNKSEMRITLVNGSTILFRSVENYEPLRGLNVSWWAADEAALYPEIVFKIMVGRLRQFGRKGYAFLATTPKGRDWIYQKWVLEADTPRRRGKFRLIRGKSNENHYLDPEIVETWQEEYTGDFARQELDGEFIAFEGLIYPEFSEKPPHVIRDTIDTRRFKQVVAGVDWGFTNPGVILIGGIDGDGRVSIIHEEYQRKRRIEEWVEVAKELHRGLKVGPWYCDPSEPDNIKLFREAGLKAQPANNSVLTGIQKVRQKLVIRDDGKPQLMITGAAPNLIKEFGQYQWAANRDGLKDEPRKANDHAQDALRYLCMGAAAPKSKARVREYNTRGEFDDE